MDQREPWPLQKLNHPTVTSHLLFQAEAGYSALLPRGCCRAAMPVPSRGLTWTAGPARVWGHPILWGGPFPTVLPQLQKLGIQNRASLRPGLEMPLERPAGTGSCQGGCRQRVVTRSAGSQPSSFDVTFFATLITNILFTSPCLSPSALQTTHFTSICMCPWYMQGCSKSAGLRKFPG